MLISGGSSSAHTYVVSPTNLGSPQIFPEMKGNVGRCLVSNRDRFEDQWYAHCATVDHQSETEVCVHECCVRWFGFYVS